MIHVREILGLPQLAEFRLLSGEGGLDNPVRAVTVMDHEIESKEFGAFVPGDFVLCGMFQIRDDPALLLEAMAGLIRAGICGLAIKSEQPYALPEGARLLSEKHNVPVFVYRSVFVEDVIVAVSDYRQLKDRHALAEQRIGGLLRPAAEPFAVENSIRELDPMLFPRCVAGYARPKDGALLIDNGATYRLMMKHSGFSGGIYKAFAQYEGGILLLYSYPAKADPGELLPGVLCAFEEIGLNAFRCAIGVSNPVFGYENYDIAISQCVRAARVAEMEQKPCLRYDEIGLWAYAFALGADRATAGDCRSRMNALQAYDKANSAELVPTLTAYIRCRGDVNAAAKALFQHPNTVRYRIKKVKSLLGLEADFYENMLAALGAYLLEN